MNSEERAKLKITRKGFLIYEPCGYWLNVNGKGIGYTNKISKAGVFPKEYMLRIKNMNCSNISFIEVK